MEEEKAGSGAGKKTMAQLALRFVILIGIVSLFADLTYEGARSINGAFLAGLGASSAVVGFVAGFGELIGYSLRSVSGFVTAKTRRYWLLAFMGYAINLLAVPALALAGTWQVAAVLMIAERTGKSMRKPSVDTLLSFSGKGIGQGWAFGLHEAFDQLGATIGPLAVAGMLLLKNDYRDGYAVLLLSALLALVSLVVARWLFPRPQDLEKEEPVRTTLASKGFQRPYWLYVSAGALIAAGFADFSLIAFHFGRTASVSVQWIPLLYAIAMAVAGLSALIFGRFLDRLGFIAFLIAFLLSALFSPFVFLGSFPFAFIGMVLWGIGMGGQGSLLKAKLAGMVAGDQRSAAFGVFDAGFGIAWFAGSAIMGLLYAISIPALILFSVLLQLAALPVFLSVLRSSARY